MKFRNKIKFLIIITIILQLTTTVFANTASNITKLQDEIAAKRQQLKDNQNKLTGIEKEVNNVRLELLDLSSEIDGKNAELESLNSNLEKVTNTLEENQKKITKTIDAQEGAEDLLRIRLRSVYENGSANTWELLFSSNTIMDFFKKKKIIEDITEYDKTLINSVSNQKDYLNGLKKDIELQKIKLEQLTYDKEKTAKALELSKSNLEYKTNQLNSNIKVLNALNASLQQEEKALDKKLEQEIIKLQQQSGQIVSEKGFVWPFPACSYVSCGYGGYVGHVGMDIAPNINQANKNIVAAKSGKVIRVVTGKRNTYPWSYDYGNYIIIDHGKGQSTLYAHLAYVNVSYGQFVTQGQKIGGCGNTGYSTGTHLHFEVRINGVAKNPANYVVRP